MSQQSRIAQALTAHRTRGSGPRLTARILATSDHDLADDAIAETFHRELYDEIAVITIRVPPLRDRRDDIPLHVRQFVREFNVELMQTIRGVDDRVARMLAEHSWPGNLCELKRVIKRACIVARGDIITAQDIGDSLTEPVFPGRPPQETALARAARAALHDRLAQANRPGSAYHDIVDIVETTLVAETLTLTNGNQAKAAEMLGVDRATLRKKMPAEN